MGTDVCSTNSNQIKKLRLVSRRWTSSQQTSNVPTAESLKSRDGMRSFVLRLKPCEVAARVRKSECSANRTEIVFRYCDTIVPLLIRGPHPTTSNKRYRVRGLESQIADLQTEAERLLRSLDVQKEDAKRQAEASQKKEEELSKSNATWKAELESLREKVKGFSDYDEIKRELEIMKVGLRYESRTDPLLLQAKRDPKLTSPCLAHSTSNLRVPRSTTTTMAR